MERWTAGFGSPLPLPRLLVVLAHPDDEVIAFGARLERLGASRLLTVTDGAPQSGTDAAEHGFPSLEAYRVARRRELQAALADANLSQKVVGALPVQIPDQAASLHLPELIEALLHEIAEFRPEALVTHPYEGGHPDHDACAFAVHTAARLCTGRGIAHAAPPVLETPFYHADPGGAMLTGRFLESPNATQALCYELSPAEQKAKARRLACFASQAQTLAQFGVERECFRPAPAYDFTQAPHPGVLLYERFPWGMEGARFRELARRATERLCGETGTVSPEFPGA